MILYKYAVADRLDVLEHKRIRFTQPAYFNDPFESRPSVTSFGSDAEIHEAVLKTFSEMDPGEFYNLVSEQADGTTKADYLEYLRSNPDEAVRNFRQLESGALPDGRERLFSTINNAIGILSLSEEPDNLLMWAHYARDHKGIVIGLDSTHEFFRPNRGSDDPIGFLEKVAYSSERPAVTIAQTPIEDLFLKKGKPWTYENEWRYVRYLQECSEMRVVNGEDCYLYALPPDCIRELIFGCRIRPEDRSRAIHLLRSDASLNHVTLLRSETDDNAYRVNLLSDGA